MLLGASLCGLGSATTGGASHSHLDVPRARAVPVSPIPRARFVDATILARSQRTGARRVLDADLRHGWVGNRDGMTSRGHRPVYDVRTVPGSVSGVKSPRGLVDTRPSCPEVEREAPISVSRHTRWLVYIPIDGTGRHGGLDPYG